MNLQQTLGLRRPFQFFEHEALLNLYYTAALARKKATGFFQQYGLTDVQFNLLMLLKHQSGPEGGLSQVQLSRMMLVNRANVTSLIDRMEKAGLVERTPDPEDRRSNIIRLRPEGEEALRKAEQPYMDEVMRVMDVLEPLELQRLTATLDRLRAVLTR